MIRNFVLIIICYSILVGAQNRLSSEPFISGDSFRSIADHLYDETSRNLNPNLVKNKDIIFIKTDFLQSFFANVHPFIKQPYIIITHNSDLSAPGKYKHYLEDQKIIVWFGMNPSCKHSKFIPIPIGIANQYWKHGNIEIFKKAILEKSSSKDILVGLNFRVDTNLDKRASVFSMFNNAPFCKKLFDDDHFSYLLKMSSARYIICPEGNGLDCHRTWETLLMGSIPIVKSSLLDELFSNMPVLIINDWSEINEQFLYVYEKQMPRTTYDVKKIYFDYWKKLILSYKKEM